MRILTARKIGKPMMISDLPPSMLFDPTEAVPTMKTASKSTETPTASQTPT